MGKKFCLSWKGKTLLGVVNKLLKTKTLLISASNILSYYLICFKPGHFVVKISLILNTHIDNPQPKSCQYEYSALYAKLNRGHYNEFPLQHTVNVCRELQGPCKEIGVQGFQIYGDCINTRNPYNF